MKTEDMNDDTVGCFWCMLVSMIQARSIANTVDNAFSKGRHGFFSLVPLSSKQPVWHASNAMDLKAEPYTRYVWASSFPVRKLRGWVLDGESLSNTDVLGVLFTDVCFFTIYRLLKEEEHLKWQVKCTMMNIISSDSLMPYLFLVSLEMVLPFMSPIFT